MWGLSHSDGCFPKNAHSCRFQVFLLVVAGLYLHCLTLGLFEVRLNMTEVQGPAPAQAHAGEG